MKKYTLEMPDDVERQLRRFRATIRLLVRQRLQDIVEGAGGDHKASVPVGPPLRFYVSEGCRVTYEVNPTTRSVVVLRVRAESS